MSPTHYTLAEAARLIDRPYWRVDRAIRTGLFTKVIRLGNYRLIAAGDLPELRRAVEAYGRRPRKAVAS